MTDQELGKCRAFIDGMNSALTKSHCQEINEAVARKLGATKSPLREGWWLFPDKHISALPDYCRDIKVAWEIVEHCDVVTYIKRPAVGGKEWHVDIGNCGWSEADTAPMAICLAFLKLDVQPK